MGHTHHHCDRRTARAAQHGGLLDCKASKGAVHRLDCAHHCGWYNFIPWRRRMRPWYNTRTSRSDHCCRDRGRGRQAAEACTEFRRRIGCSASASKRPSNHRGRVTIDETELNLTVCCLLILLFDECVISAIRCETVE